MNILTFLTIWVVFVITISFVKLKWAISFYLAYIILVPYVDLGAPWLSSWFIILIMIFNLYRNNAKQINGINIKPLFPFLVYYVVSLILMLFQEYVPFDWMAIRWRRDFISIIVFPAIIWNVMIQDPSSVRLFRKIMLFCIIIAISYGLILTMFRGINPYIIYMLQFVDYEQDMESYYEASNGGRLFGRISSVFIHPMSFAFYIGLSFIYLNYIKETIKRYLFFLITIATFLMALFCGVRSVLGGLAVALLYYLIKDKNRKKTIKFLITGVLLFLIITFLSDDVSNYIASMSDLSNQNGDVKGSSIEMRLNQLVGAIEETLKSPIFGLGYEWTEYYQSKFGIHPICLNFESLLFVVICNSGIVGCILWLYMVICYLIYNKRHVIFETNVINSLIVFYISYSFITGEYGYMKLFLLFYVLMLGESLHKEMKVL